MMGKLKKKKFHITVAFGVVIAGVLLFQGIVPKEAREPKIDSISPTQGLAGTEVTITGSGFTTSIQGIVGTKVKDQVLDPGNYVLVKDEALSPPLLSPDGKTLTVRLDLVSGKIKRECEEKFSKKNPEPCKVPIKVVNAYGKPSNDMHFTFTPSSFATRAPTISFVRMFDGLGAVPNNMIVAHAGENFFIYGNLLQNPANTYSYPDNPSNEQADVYLDGRLWVSKMPVDTVGITPATYPEYGLSSMGFSFPEGTTLALGSFHTISVKTKSGMSNALPVQVVEYVDVHPSAWGMRPDQIRFGDKMEIGVTEPFDDSRNDRPISSVMHIGLILNAPITFPDGTTSSGGVVFPKDAVGLVGLTGENSHVYSINFSKEAVYCPSWLVGVVKFSPTDPICRYAPPDTAVTISTGGPNQLSLSYEYTFKYRGRVIGGIPLTPLLPDWFNIFTIIR